MHAPLQRSAGTRDELIAVFEIDYNKDVIMKAERRCIKDFEFDPHWARGRLLDEGAKR
jgi:hypothetical protein